MRSLLSGPGLLLLAILGSCLALTALAQGTIDGIVGTPTDTEALAGFPYCVCSDYRCRASPYRLRYKSTGPDPRASNLKRICYTVEQVSKLHIYMLMSPGPCHACIPPGCKGWPRARCTRKRLLRLKMKSYDQAASLNSIAYALRLRVLTCSIDTCKSWSFYTMMHLHFVHAGWLPGPNQYLLQDNRPEHE